MTAASCLTILPIGCGTSADTTLAVAVAPDLPDLPAAHRPRCAFPDPAGEYADRYIEHRFALKECADKHDALKGFYSNIRARLRESGGPR